MRVIPHLLVLAAFLVSPFIISCGSLSRPNYRGAGDTYSPAYDRYARPQYKGNQRQPVPRKERTGPMQLQWPVKRIDVSQKFAPRKNPSHQGLDLRGPKGTPIYAAHDGTVVYTGSAFRGYGKMIILEYNKQWATLYAHLDNYTVREGQEVAQGELIGKMGRTGRTTGVHLHFELMRGKQPIDPFPRLQSSQRYVSK